jgi:hypothetical protein
VKIDDLEGALNRVQTTLELCCHDYEGCLQSRDIHTSEIFIPLSQVLLCVQGIGGLRAQCPPDLKLCGGFLI